MTIIIVVVSQKLSCQELLCLFMYDLIYATERLQQTAETA